MALLLLVLAIIQACGSVYKDYIGRQHKPQNQYYKSGGLVGQAWATYKAHDMSMDFFTAMTGFVAFLVAVPLLELLSGGTYLETNGIKYICQFLNLLSVFEDIVEI